MIVYREQRRKIRTQEALGRVEAATGFARAMEIGELQAGVADALCPVRDADLPQLRALRGLALGASAGLPELPATIEISVPEGFAYYALHPELYRMAARRFVLERAAGRVAVIGIRSIGATLAAIVELELRRLGCETDSWTVRPRGHPWNRELRVAGDLARAWGKWAGEFAIVDEGPGLSGSSFASVAEFLSGLGIADERIAMFPSWLPDGAGFVSQRARERWVKHAKYSASFNELGLFPGARDLSGGRWREFRGIWPAVQPQHERRKYLVDGSLRKFAGYGRYGRAKLERARALGRYTAQPCGLEDGFLVMPWVEGREVSLGPALIDHAAEYMAFIRREFAGGAAPVFEPLAEMIAVNAPQAPDVSGWRAAVEDGAAVALDARMFPHEWLETAAGFLKTDALEHHDDHFFPGPQDAAWDLAGFSVEFRLDAAGEERLVDRYRRASGDRGVKARMPFYRLAYLAFRLGYTEMAVQALGDGEDAARFRRERARYASLVELEAGRV